MKESPAGPKSWTTGRFPIFLSLLSLPFLLSPSVRIASCETVLEFDKLYEMHGGFRKDPDPSQVVHFVILFNVLI